MITGEQVVTKVRELAAANPNFQYNEEQGLSCFYRLDNAFNKPRCIVGQAIFELTGEEVAPKYEGMGAYSMLPEVALRCTAEQLSWCGDVQAAQDTCSTWGAAVALADSITVALRTAEFSV